MATAAGTQPSNMLEGRARTWSILALVVLCLGLVLYLFRPFAPRHSSEAPAPQPQARAPEPEEQPMSPEARTRMRGVTTMVPFFLSPYAGGGQ